jgi:hypothetical protein
MRVLQRYLSQLVHVVEMLLCGEEIDLSALFGAPISSVQGESIDLHGNIN